MASTGAMFKKWSGRPIRSSSFSAQRAQVDTDWIEVQVQGTPADPQDITTGHSEKRRLSTLH